MNENLNCFFCRDCLYTTAKTFNGKEKMKRHYKTLTHKDSKTSEGSLYADLIFTNYAINKYHKEAGSHYTIKPYNNFNNRLRLMNSCTEFDLIKEDGIYKLE